MSTVWLCDYCGEEIVAGMPYATVTVDHRNQKGLPKRERWTSGYAGHYHHDSPEDCWGKLHDAIKLVHEFGPSIEQIPTISGQAVAARRRKHHRPEGGE